MNNFFETLRQFGAMRLTVMAAVVLGLLLFFVFVMLRISQPGMKILYTELTPNDSSSIAGALEEAGIPYEISPDGGRVMVAGNAVGRARLLLADKGLPDGGSLGYEIFDERTGFGTTEFVQNINQVRALEGELARTVTEMEAVRTARVHLVLPKRELFERRSRKAKASVLLDLRPGAKLDDRKAASIQALVASAVPDLRPDDVTVVLSDNTLVAGGVSDGEGAAVAHRNQDMRRHYEEGLARKIEDQVGRVVGFDKVRAIVTADMNFDRISMEEELYDPGGQVVRSAQVTEESGSEVTTPSVEVSVANNLPGLGPEAGGGGRPGSENSRLQEVTNFEISRTVRSTVSEGGQVKKLSVSVLVDGNYSPAPAAEDGAASGELAYTPRTDEELARIAALVRSAIGFDEDRGDMLEVVNMKFATLPISELTPEENLLFGMPRDQIMDAVETGVLSIVAILVVLLIVQPMITRLVSADMTADDDSFDTEMLAAQSMAALPEPEEEEFEEDIEEEEEESLINIAGVEGKVKASAIKKVEEIVENYPNEAVSVIRSWMTDTRGE